MDFIFTLQPFIDESLISYLYRHSTKNNYPVEWIFSELYFRTQNKKHEIINLSTLDIKRISNVLGLESNKVNNMTFNKYNIYEYSQLLNLESTRYCPQCLKEEGYYRLYWDIRPIKICMNHKVFLVDTCDNCGNKVSIPDIINSKCSCGSDLSKSIIKICEDEFIINQQNDLLRKIGISFSNGNVLSYGEYNKSFFNSLYNKLVCFIQNKRHRLRKLNRIFEEYTHLDDEFYTLIILHKIKSNLELYLPILLDDLNQIYLDLDRVADYYIKKGNSICNPLSEIVDYIHDFDMYFEQHTLFYNCLNKYFKDNYNCSFFNIKLHEYISDDGFIELSTASHIFNIDENTLIDSVSIFKNKKYSYVALKDVINVIYSIIARHKIYEVNKINNIDKDYISFPEVSKLFRNFNIKENDIIKIINDNEIYGIINICSNNIGMNLLKFRKEKLFPILLREALQRYIT